MMHANAPCWTSTNDFHIGRQHSSANCVLRSRIALVQDGAFARFVEIDGVFANNEVCELAQVQPIASGGIWAEMSLIYEVGEKLFDDGN